RDRPVSPGDAALEVSPVLVLAGASLAALRLDGALEGAALRPAGRREPCERGFGGDRVPRAHVESFLPAPEAHLLLARADRLPSARHAVRDGRVALQPTLSTEARLTRWRIDCDEGDDRNERGVPARLRVRHVLTSREARRLAQLARQGQGE